MKQLKISILLTVLLSMVSTKMSAAYTYYFTVENADGKVIRYYKFVEWRLDEVFVGVAQSNYSGSIVIPDSVTYRNKTYPVSSIGTEAFKNCSELTSVTIPSTVTSICTEAFKNCTGLTSITIPPSVETIQESAFNGCTGLTSITIPPSVIQIRRDAFNGCTGLTSITIPPSVRDIYGGAFDNTAWYNSQPDGLVYLDDIAYNYKGTMPPNTSIEIKEGTQRIANEAFYYCSELTSVTIPSSVKIIGYESFYRCTGLTSITIPPSVETIQQFAFYGCTGLTSVTLPHSVKVLDAYAFSCTSLTDINIPDSVAELKASTFSGCSALKTLIIPYALTTIQSEALESVSLDNVVLFPDKDITFTNDKYNFYNAKVVLVSPKSKRRYSNSNYHSIVDISSTQTTMTLKSTDYYTLEKVVCDGREIDAVDGDVHINDLHFGTEYKITIYGRAFDREVHGDIYWETQDISIRISSVWDETTNIRTKVRATYDLGDVPFSVTSVDFGEYGAGEVDVEGGNVRTLSVTFENGQSKRITFYVHTSDGNVYTASGYFSGRSAVSGTEHQVGTNYATLVGRSNIIDATLVKSGFGDTGKDSVVVYGLDPNSTYESSGYSYNYTLSKTNNLSTEKKEYYKKLFTYSMETLERGVETRQESFRTASGLTLETQYAVPLSTNKARLSLKTNGADDKQRYGFEWRRYDAPEEMPSYVVTAPTYDGVCMGTLNNVNPDAYYKYRAMYKSDAGNVYYGDWVVFSTADGAVYFEPVVHTVEADNVTEESVVLKGIAVEGSDEIVEQGFEYWPKDESQPNAARMKAVKRESNKTTVVATGNQMTVTLEGLSAGTVYCYRSYVKTANGVTYGEEKEFKTAGEKSDTPKVGDVNNDTKVDAADVTALANYLVGIGELANPAAAYVNDDDKIDIVDLTLLIELIK